MKGLANQRLWCLEAHKLNQLLTQSKGVRSGFV